MIKCEECGHEVPKDASVCPYCGCPVELNDTGQDAEFDDIYQEEMAEDEPKKRKVWLWVLTIAVVCVIGGGGYYGCTHFGNGDGTNEIDSIFDNKNAIVEITPEFIKAIEKYDQLGCFSEGYAAVKRGGKWGYINTEGEEVIPATIDAYCVGRFSEGLAFVAVTRDADFSVINTKGETLYKVKQDFILSDDSDDLPYFIEGKLYIPIEACMDFTKYQACDKDGTKQNENENEMDWYNVEEGVWMSAAFRLALNTDYLVFEEIDSDGRLKCGLKEAKGNVLISSKYNNISGEWIDEEIVSEAVVRRIAANLSNGVVRVCLWEYGENSRLYGNEEPIKHYGYADLKGNDTFSEALKERCRKSEQVALENTRRYNEEQEKLNSEREITIYMRGYMERGEEYSSLEGNYGINVIRPERYLWTDKITVPNGKVWIFNGYKNQNNYAWTIGFVQYHCYHPTESDTYKSVYLMNGERFYAGKQVFLVCSMYGKTGYFNVEVSFIEKDESTMY